MMILRIMADQMERDATMPLTINKFETPNFQRDAVNPTQRCRVLAVMVVMICCFMLASISDADEKGIADFPGLSATADWPWWRGPSRNGIADSILVPTAFSETENVIWKSAVPGRGHASPTVVGNYVFLATADEKQKTQSVVAFDRLEGKVLWNTQVNQGGFPAKNHPKNTEASSTVASDGERVFATFYHHDHVGAVSLNLNGEIIWKKDVCKFRPRTYEYGYAPSPVIYQDNVLISAEYDGDSFITALNRKTGERAWQAPRPTMITFSTPVIAHVGGKDQMLISGALKVASYSPATGSPFWSADGTTFATCGTMVWDESKNIVFASGGYPKAETVAVRADGSGEVLWHNNQKCYEQSMLAYEGYVYALTDNGVMFCWRGTDGKEMWKERLKGPVSASPVLANGNIYWANELGTLYVFRATPDRFEMVAENHVGTDSFPSPAICGGQIFLRVGNGNGPARKETLYCFGNLKAK